MTAFLRLFLIELKLALRDHGNLFFMLAIPLFVLVIFSISFKTVDALLPSMAVAVSLALNALYLVPTYLGAYRESGVLRRLSTTPMHPGLLLGAQLGVQLLITVIAVALVVITSAVLGIALPRNPGGALITFALGALAMFAIGILIAALSSSGRMASGVGILLYWPMAFLGGLTVPAEQMPALLAHIGAYTPLGGFRQSVHDTWMGGAVEPANLVIMAAYAIAAACFAAGFFRWE